MLMKESEFNTKCKGKSPEILGRRMPQSDKYFKGPSETVWITDCAWATVEAKRRVTSPFQEARQEKVAEIGIVAVAMV